MLSDLWNVFSVLFSSISYNGIMQYVVFYVWLFSITIIIFRRVILWCVMVVHDEMSLEAHRDVQERTHPRDAVTSLLQEKNSRVRQMQKSESDLLNMKVHT